MSGNIALFALLVTAVLFAVFGIDDDNHLSAANRFDGFFDRGKLRHVINNGKKNKGPMDHGAATAKTAACSPSAVGRR